MKPTIKLAAVLLLTAGCVGQPAPAPRILVRVPAAPDIALEHCPDLSGAPRLHAHGVARHPVSGVVMPWSLSGTVAVVAHRDGHWYAVTCWHCIENDDNLTVDGRAASVWVEDRPNDLALVRFKSDKYYHQYAIGTPRLGQTVYAVGWTSSPTDSPPDLRGSQSLKHVRKGIVSWVRKNTLGFDGGARMGFSGGPLLTADSKLVGINQRLYTFEGVFAAAVHPRHVRTLLYSLP